MGQPVTVIQKPTSKPWIVRFDINRSLTGMGHEKYRSIEEAQGDRPPDVLARRLFERGGIISVHVYSNTITVELAHGVSSDGLREMIEQLFIHYRDGVQPSIP